MNLIDKEIQVFKNRGFRVLKRHNRNYYIKNRGWKGFSGFKTEMDAWRFLMRVKEPRPKSIIEQHNTEHSEEVQKERFQIKHDLFKTE